MSATHPPDTQPWRLLSSIRFHEVVPLQGSPAVGAALAVATIGIDEGLRAVLLLAASCCLVAHAFLLNDWAGIDGDLRSATRADRTFATKGIGRSSVGYLAVALLVAGLALCGLLGGATFAIALGIVGVSALYSAPWTHWKGSPVFGTLLHLAGGSLHFLLGYAAFAPVDGRGFATSCFFGLVFAAGHLMHETRDHDGDLANGIRTNAVVFGRRWSFLAGLALFSAAYWLLVGLALWGTLPLVVLASAAAFALHLHASLNTLRQGLTVDGLLRLQRCYHLIVAALGLLLVASAHLPW